MYGLIGKMTYFMKPRQQSRKGRPLIAGFSNRVETTPIGGYGLTRDGTD